MGDGAGVPCLLLRRGIFGATDAYHSSPCTKTRRHVLYKAFRPGGSTFTVALRRSQVILVLNVLMFTLTEWATWMQACGDNRSKPRGSIITTE